LTPDEDVVVVDWDVFGKVGVGGIEVTTLDDSVVLVPEVCEVVVELELVIDVVPLSSLRTSGLTECLSENEDELLFPPSEKMKMSEMQARTVSTINVKPRLYDQRVVAVISIHATPF